MASLLNSLVASATLTVLRAAVIGPFEPCRAHRSDDGGRGTRSRTRLLHHRRGAAVGSSRHLGLPDFVTEDGLLFEGPEPPYGDADDEVPRYGPRKSCKEGIREGGKGGKGGKGSTCSPSVQPSSVPSVSAGPSFGPTATVAPSAAPSPEPSNEPSSGPSSVPSFAPSVSPSSEPSVGPSFGPSAAPVVRPSIAPSSIPTRARSEIPTYGPSPGPSSEPTVKATETPSVAPSVPPSPVPTASHAPTMSSQTTLETFVSSSNDGTHWESTCIADQPSGGTFQEQRLVFLYYLYLTEGSDGGAVADAVDSMEGKIHNGLAGHFLSCNVSYDEDKVGAFDIWKVTSSPLDSTLSDDECFPDDASLLLSPPNSTCVAVVADLGMIVHFPRTNARRRGDRRRLTVTEANLQVLETCGEYLDEAMTGGDFNGENVLQVSFEGFVLPENTPEGRFAGGEVPPVTAGASEELQANSDDSKVAAGATMLAFAIVCFIAVAVLAVYRRKVRHVAYVKYLDGMESVTDGDLDKGYDVSDRTTEIVGEMSFDSLDQCHEESPDMWVTNDHGMTQRPTLGGLNHQNDVHRCTSAYCDVCRSYRASRPTFVPSSFGPESILKDLRHRPSIADSENKRLYTSADTREL